MLSVAWQDARFTAGSRNAIAVYRAHDGATWAETRIGNTSFDNCQAPLTGSGYFLGDYQGLVTAGTAVLAIFVATTGSADNRTDVYTPRLDGATGVNGSAAHAARTMGLPMTVAEGDALRRAHSAAVSQALERRLPGWEARAAALAKGRAESRPH